MNRYDDDLLKGQRPEDLCSRCREETARFRHGARFDDGACFELFRRAIVERDERCWGGLVAIYDDEVRVWCRRAAAGQALDLDELVCLTWEKFWRHCTADKLRAAGCTGRVLGYLKACARSVVIDALRGRSAVLPLDPAIVDLPDGAPSVAELHASAAADVALWRAVYDHLKCEPERALVHLRYEVGLTSAETHAQRPDLFPCVGDVYRVTRKVLDRLRRSRSLRDWWADRC